MLIKPQIHRVGALWTVLDENDYFSLLHHKLSISKWTDSFRIILKSSPQRVIALSASIEGIKADWEQINKDILARYNKKELEKEQIIRMLVTKFESLSVDTDEVEQKEQIKDAALQDQFRKIFEIPKDEKLVSAISCSLWDKLPMAGTLYLSENYLCFYSAFMKKPLSIPFTDIKTISKDSVKGMQSIKIVTASKQEYFFSKAFKRDDLYSSLLHMWNLNMRKVMKKTEDNLEILEHNNYNITQSISVDAGSLTPWDVKTILNKKRHLDQIVKDKEYQTLFQLPTDEILLKDIPCKLQKNKTLRKGQLYISSHFLCFEANPYGLKKFFSVVVPFQEIIKISKGRTIDDQSGEQVLDGSTFEITTPIAVYILVVSNRDRVYDFIMNLYEQQIQQQHEFNESGSIWANSIVEKIPKEMYADKKQFSDSFSTKNANQDEEWIKYFLKHGSAISIVKTRKARNLIQSGISNNFRGRLWMIFSGGYAYMITRKKTYYYNLLAKGPSSFSDEIEKDLTRTFPGHPFYKTEEGIGSLRNVLTVYSWHNPNIGYCQSMNIVTALLLLFLPEDQTFYMLCAICEILIPDYYVKVMIGSTVDMRLFEELLAERCPEIHQKLDNFGLPIPMIALPWFLCLFIGYVPLEVSLRILDCFFYEGPDILLPLALALFKLNEKVILEARDGTKVTDLLKKSDYECEQLLKLAFSEYDSLSLDKIDEMRNALRFKAIKEMEDKANLQRIRELAKTTHFSIDELDKLYMKMLEHSANFTLNASQFSTFTEILAPWLKIDKLKLFKSMDRKNLGSLEFIDCITSWSIICKGTKLEQFQYFFSLNDTDLDNKLNELELREFVEEIHSLYKRPTAQLPIVTALSSPPTSPTSSRLKTISNSADLISFDDENKPGRELGSITTENFDADRLVTIVMFENMSDELGKLSLKEAEKLLAPHFQL